MMFDGGPSAWRGLSFGVGLGGIYNSKGVKRRGHQDIYTDFGISDYTDVL